MSLLSLGCGGKPPAAKGPDKPAIARELGLAVVTAESLHRTTEALTRRDADGKPLLSWRVTILPHLEQVALHRKFDFEKAWDSEANREHSKVVIPYYVTDYAKEPGTTTWKLVPSKRGGILLVEGGEGSAVPWAQPDEVKLDGDDPLVSFGKEPADGFTVVLEDGQVGKMKGALLKEKLAK